MRGDAFGFLRLALGHGQPERGAIVDGRQPAPQCNLAPDLEFLRGLVAGVDPAGFQHGIERGPVAIQAGRLALLAVPVETEPCQVGADRIDIVFAAALRVGVIDPQDETAAILPREHPVVERGADIADMQQAGRRRGEASDGAHAGER